MIKIIGISGGSGSGKTTLARKIVASFPANHCTVLSQDHYYIDQSDRFDKDGGAVNFDHPSSLDFALLARHTAELKSGRPINVPIYDFPTHKRLKETTLFAPSPLIILEGTLLFSQEPIRTVCDVKIFVDVPQDVRFSRRLKRDVEERGRKPEGVREQFIKQVKPMHDEFVEPSKKFADILVLNDDYDACIKALKTEPIYS